MALEEGRNGLGLVQPNPPVGCVIVSPSGDILGKGAHLQYGGPHAEVNALSSVVSEDSLKDATVFVTLEPCAFEGKTPSCAKTLAALPIAKVVYAVQDPNPKVSGKGAQILRDAGKEVEELQDEKLVAECEALAEVFHWNMKNELPFVALKAATSQNGSLTPDTDSKWISSEESRKHVHFLRSQYDSVLVGVGTFLDDNPKLNIRLADGTVRENYAIVLDPSGRGLEKLSDSELMKSRAADKIIWVVTEKVDAPEGVQVLKVAKHEEGIDLKALLKRLSELDITSVFIEGGAKTYGAFLNDKLVNRIYHYTGPMEVSEANMLDWLSYVNGGLIAEGPIDSQTIGPDKFQSFLLNRS